MRRDTAVDVDPYDLDEAGLRALLGELGEPRYRAGQLRAWLVAGVDDPQQMTNLPRTLRDHLTARFSPRRPRLTAHRVADGGRTHKLLLELPDREAIETVLMLYPAGRHGAARATVCISTQAGCAMGCPFCATGQLGLRRQLRVGEVVRQVVLADAALRSGELDVPRGAPDHVTNVVYMGMGEPLANLDVTLRSLDWLHDPDGFGLSARSITVSTVGLVPGIRALAAHGLPVTLALSLHAADDALRDDLVPVNRQHPLAELERALHEYRAATNRRVSLEWCLIADVNDRPSDARALAAFARRTRAHVNVIPMNPTPGVDWEEPTSEVTRRFVADVAGAGAEVTLRDTRGRDADAACGQLLASQTLGSGRRLPAAVGAAARVEARELPRVEPRGLPLGGRA